MFYTVRLQAAFCQQTFTLAAANVPANARKKSSEEQCCTGTGHIQ